MSRKIKDFIKIVAALLAVVAVVGLLGSFISQRNGDEDTTESDSIRFEENTEEVVVDHSKCENEHNWSLYTNRYNDAYINGYGYICGVCKTLIHPSRNFYFGQVFEVVDLSKAHRYSNSTGLTSHFNYVNSGDFLYISSASFGEEVTTSFEEINTVHHGLPYMAIGYRVKNPDARNLTLEIVLDGQTNSFTVAEPTTNGWVYVVLDLSTLKGYSEQKGTYTEDYTSVAVSFKHDFNLDVLGIFFGDSKQIARNLPGYNGTYYDRGSDFASVGTEVYAE